MLEDFDFEIDSAIKEAPKSDRLIVIVDLEGVLLDFKHRNRYINGDTKDWKAFERECVHDEAYPEAAKFMRHLKKNYTVHIQTARSVDYMADTRRQLKDADIPFDVLTMRPANCFKKTPELMRTWLGELSPERVAFVISNRFATQQMYIAEGISCLQLQHAKERDELF